MRAAGELGQRGVADASSFVEQLGDTEVQQPDLAFLRHEDVGRFEIAMHDEPCMGVRDSLDDLQEQANARVHVEPFTRAVRVDGAPFDVLEGEIRTAAGRDPRLVQARDVGVGKRCQDVALARHPFHEVGTQPCAARQLQRNLTLEQSVRAFSEPDGAHAARADAAQQTVRADDCAGLVRVRTEPRLVAIVRRTR